MKFCLEDAEGRPMPAAKETFHLLCSEHSPQVERFRANVSTTHFPAHVHDGYVVGLIHRGVQKLVCQSETYFAQAGSITFLNPQEIHSAGAASSDGVTYETLHLPAHMVEMVAQAQPLFRNPVLHSPVLARQLAQAFHQLDSAGTKEQWRAKISDIVILALQAQKQTPERSRTEYGTRIQHLLGYIEDNITESLSLKVLSSVVGISQQHLIRSFKCVLGVTPHDYIQLQKVALAKRMLQDLSPSEVAAMTGFADQSHFTRRLKACYGITPSLYRKQLQSRSNSSPGARAAHAVCVANSTRNRAMPPSNGRL